MSDSVPFFHPASFGNFVSQSFAPKANFSFTLGNLDLSNALPSTSNGSNKENFEKKMKKGGDRDRRHSRKPTDETFPEHMMKSNESSNQILNLAGDEENNQGGNVSKASKKIRKQTYDKLRKRVEKDQPEHMQMRNKNMNKKRNFRTYAPGKSLDSTMFHKTKICPHFIEGMCKRGEACNYAHSQGELKETPNLKKTKVCQLFQVGRCNMGNYCSFAHGDQELRSTPDFFKTSLCSAHLRGVCRMGDKCRYAHGESELRQAILSGNQHANNNHSRRELKEVTNSSQNVSSSPIIASSNLLAMAHQADSDIQSMLKTFNHPNISAGSMFSLDPQQSAVSTTQSSFTGFERINPLSNITRTNTQESFGNPSRNLLQAFSTQAEIKPAEKKTPVQASLNENIAFNVVDPQKFASFLTSTSNKNFFN